MVLFHGFFLLALHDGVLEFSSTTASFRVLLVGCWFSGCQVIGQPVNRVHC